MHVDVVLDPGAGDPALVEADVVAVRVVDVLEAGSSPRCARAIISATVSRRQLLDPADVLVGSHHQVPVRVREEVEDHEAALAAVDDQVRLVVPAAGLAQKMHSSSMSFDASFT